MLCLHRVGKSLFKLKLSRSVSTVVNMVETVRKLASVVKINNLHAIKNKDLIVQAEINGWRCIVKKGEFQVGDLGIYLAIDSVPDFTDPHFEFLKEKCTRIKTIKMGGVVSQGLLCPLDWLTSRGHDASMLKEGDDVGELMGVTKYVADEERGQYITGPKLKSFPVEVPKTDATRLQDDPLAYFESIVDKEIIITRKEDGCSCTFMYNNGIFSLCGRNVVWEESNNNCAHYFYIADTFQIAEKLAALNRNIAIQGEMIGPKINGNRMKLTEKYFRVFDIFDIDTQSYLTYDEVTDICTQFGLTQVPLIFRGPVSELLALMPNSTLSMDGFLAIADKQEYVKGVVAEGIVVKTNHPAQDVDGTATPRTVFKVISNKYLLKHDL